MSMLSGRGRPAVTFRAGPCTYNFTPGTRRESKRRSLHMHATLSRGAMHRPLPTARLRGARHGPSALTRPTVRRGDGLATHAGVSVEVVCGGGVRAGRARSATGLGCSDGGGLRRAPGRGSQRKGRSGVCRARTEAEERDDEEVRRRLLLQYVQSVDASVMDTFVERAPKQVVDAMRQTVKNMLGVLPAQFFEVTVTTVGENLAQLMYSVMMTGYMFRNAQYRMELGSSMAALPSKDPSPTDQEEGTEYAPGTQKTRVSGDVLRWSEENGVEPVDAVSYMESLEGEVAALKEKVRQLQAANAGHNTMLDYLKNLEPTNLQDLTATTGPEVLEAMNAFIYRLIGTDDGDELKNADTSSSTVELARMLYWLLVVGYSLRTMEVRFEMERSLGLPPSSAPSELPPAEDE